MENDLAAGIEWVSISQYLGVRDRFFWVDSLLARLALNRDPANVERIVAEWRRGYRGDRIDGSEGT